jgi:ribosome-associated protein
MATKKSRKTESGAVASSARKEADPAVVDVDAANRGWIDDGEEAKETRGEKKRKALQLERLGESLVELPTPKLGRVPMPDDLAAAVREARRLKEIRALGGYRRQVQFIGKIMRNLDALPIAEALETMKGEDAPGSAAFQQAEQWRDRLVAGDDADLDALLLVLPSLDRTHLRQLVRQAQKEARDNKPAHAARSIFRTLRPLFLS